MKLPQFLLDSPIIQELYRLEGEKMAKAQNGLKSVGSLWKGTTGDGSTMLSGFVSIGVMGPDVNLLIFKNKKKSKSNDPDFFITVKTETKEPDIPMPPKADDL